MLLYLVVQCRLMKKKHVFLVTIPASCLLAALLLTGCGRMITPTPKLSSITPAPTPITEQAQPTATPHPTSTPRPATPIASPTPTLTPTPTIYTIQSGDTLLKIAIRFNISTEAIQEANGIVDPRFLQIGQTLIIPPPDEDPEAPPSPTPTPLPLDVTTINFQETRQGTLWCLGRVSNPGDTPLTEVVIEASLLDANGVLLSREATYTQLDVIPPKQSVPFSILFKTPPREFAQYQVIPVSGVPLLSEQSRYYFDLETFDLRGSPEGAFTYNISAQLRNYGQADAESIRLVAVVFDEENRVLAQRQADLAVNVLRAGATTPFQIDLIIPSGTVDHYEVLAQGLQAQ